MSKQDGSAGVEGKGMGIKMIELDIDNGGCKLASDLNGTVGSTLDLITAATVLRSLQYRAEARSQVTVRFCNFSK